MCGGAVSAGPGVATTHPFSLYTAPRLLPTVEGGSCGGAGEGETGLVWGVWEWRSRPQTAQPSWGDRGRQDHTRAEAPRSWGMLHCPTGFHSQNPDPNITLLRISRWGPQSIKPQCEALPSIWPHDRPGLMARVKDTPTLAHLAAISVSGYVVPV